MRLSQIRSFLLTELPFDPWQACWSAGHWVFHGRPRPWTGKKPIVLVAVFLGIAYVVGYATGKADGAYERQGLDEQILPLEAENYGLRSKLGLPQYGSLSDAIVMAEAMRNGKRASAAPTASATATPTVVVGAPADGMGAAGMH